MQLRHDTFLFCTVSKLRMCVWLYLDSPVCFHGLVKHWPAFILIFTFTFTCPPRSSLCQATHPSLSMLLSHASPTRSLSESTWFVLWMRGQLSHTSPSPSPSASRWSAFFFLGQLSKWFGIPVREVVVLLMLQTLSPHFTAVLSSQPMSNAATNPFV